MSLHCHNHVAKKRSIAPNVSIAVRTAIIKENLILSRATSTAKVGVVKWDPSNNTTVLLKKCSKNGTRPVSRVPTPLGPGALQVNGPMCAVLSSLQTPMQNDSYVSTARWRFIAKGWCSSQKSKHVTAERGLNMRQMSAPFVERERERRHDHSGPMGLKRSSLTR